MYSYIHKKYTFSNRIFQYEYTTALTHTRTNERVVGFHQNTMDHIYGCLDFRIKIYIHAQPKKNLPI